MSLAYMMVPSLAERATQEGHRQYRGKNPCLLAARAVDLALEAGVALGRDVMEQISALQSEKPDYLMSYIAISTLNIYDYEGLEKRGLQQITEMAQDAIAPHLPELLDALPPNDQFKVAQYIVFCCMTFYTADIPALSELRRALEDIRATDAPSEEQKRNVLTQWRQCLQNEAFHMDYTLGPLMNGLMERLCQPSPERGGGDGPVAGIAHRESGAQAASADQGANRGSKG